MIYGGLIVLVSLARPAGLVSLSAGSGPCPAGRAEPALSLPRGRRGHQDVRRRRGQRRRISFDGRGGRDPRPDRPQRRRQDQPVQLDRAARSSPDRGEIRLDGTRISGMGPVACARAGDRPHVPGGAQLRQHDGAGERHGRRLRPRRRRPRRRCGWPSEVLAFCGLEARADAPAHQLTPPEKRRLEIARALATRPRVLLLDEMLTGLTPTEAAAASRWCGRCGTRGSRC